LPFRGSVPSLHGIDRDAISDSDATADKRREQGRLRGGENFGIAGNLQLQRARMIRELRDTFQAARAENFRNGHAAISGRTFENDCAVSHHLCLCFPA